MRAAVRIAAGLVVLLTLGFVVVRWTAGPEAVAEASVVGEHGDAGDGLAPTSFDDAMVRKVSAIGALPQKGVNPDRVRDELRALAAKAGIGPLTDASFAVFSQDMLNYLVPPVTLTLPASVPLDRAEAFMRDHQPADVAFYQVQEVLVHSLTFAVIPAGGVTAAQVSRSQEDEGILYDALNRYDTTVQTAGVTVRYFGAVLSDATIAVVRDAMGRAAKVPADQVVVAATMPGPGIDLSNGPPPLNEVLHTGHHS